ncbi:unknown protein [Seminavis robusta]|uniref:Protein kinase domain-containing protein n=1 Tax=Seminavis robusta TaxID=568900 RepID=A0A9N8EKM0_9STRA|nr:unknown protein [Seminavis robusta]|eukprot:Sro1344_g264680.1 n/a (164) ;mRNA; r:6974-7465
MIRGKMQQQKQTQKAVQATEPPIMYQAVSSLVLRRTLGGGVPAVVDTVGGGTVASADPTYDTWAYGVVIYEAIAKVPLSPYACRGKRDMNALEVCKIGMWDEQSVKKALKHVQDDDVARDLLRQLLHHDLNKQFTSMRQVGTSVFLGRNPEGIRASSSAEGVR